MKVSTIDKLINKTFVKAVNDFIEAEYLKVKDTPNSPPLTAGSDIVGAKYDSLENVVIVTYYIHQMYSTRKFKSNELVSEFHDSPNRFAKNFMRTVLKQVEPKAIQQRITARKYLDRLLAA